MNCTFLSSLSSDVHWLFHNYQYTNDHNKLIPINNNLLKQWTINSMLKNKFGLWMIVTSLNFQLTDIMLHIMNSVEKIFKTYFFEKFIFYSWDYQILKQLLEFLIIIQFEGNYLCESSNSMGIEQGSMTLYVQKPLNSLVSFSEVTSVYINEQNAYRYEGSEKKLYGPLFCQFYGKPALNEINWWKYTGLNSPEQNTHNDWELIYQIKNFNDSISIEETSNLLIITGTPALITSSVFNFSTYEEQSSYEFFIHNLHRMSYRFTMFTMLWLKKFNLKDYGYYKCQSRNELGSTSEIRQFQKPASPPIITELHHIQSTWTSVTIFWKPNEYYNSPINFQYRDLSNSTVNNIRNKIQHLLSIWLRRSQNEQKYFIHLEDYGIVNETTSYLQDSFKSLNDSINANDVNPTSYQRKETNYKEDSLMSNHLYTVTISRVNQYGQSKPSRPLAFRTKALHLELPGPIHLDETKEIIQFSKGNPAICAQVEMSTTNNDSISSIIWNSIHFSSNYSPYIIVNKNIFYSEMNNRYVELSNCKPLSWNHYTEISIRLQQKYYFRARYCIYGYNTICTEYIQPIKDISTHIVIIAALLCITLVILLSSMFIYLVCKHLNKTNV
ncbi:Peroxidasin-like protein [Schistosoma japonicum]|nr:Peroxidasin-like protein [Schistosoma japonicum]